MTARRDLSTSLIRWGTIAGITGLIAALFADVILDLASDWWNLPEASYGMLVPPTALYIAYLQRRTTLAVPAQKTLRGLWLVAFGCIVFLLGKLAGEFFLARISIVFVLAGLTWTFWGSTRLKTLGFPFVLLATMVPLPAIVYNALASPLQLFASRIATDLAQMLGVVCFSGRKYHSSCETTSWLGVEDGL